MSAIINIIALAIVSIVAGNEAKAQNSNCGDYPTGFKALFGDAKERFLACKQRERDEERAKIEAIRIETQTKIDRGRESCMNAIRRLSSRPETLSFDYVQQYTFLSGTKASGFEQTDGGYSARVTGSDISGHFNVVCYMDKNYRITGIK